MPKEGTINNPHGRPIGSKNLKTEQWEMLSDSILNCHTERFNKLLSELNGLEFMEAYLKILGYFKPKMKAIDHTTTNDNIIQVVYFSDAE